MPIDNTNYQQQGLDRFFAGQRAGAFSPFGQQGQNQQPQFQQSQGFNSNPSSNGVGGQNNPNFGALGANSPWQNNNGAQGFNMAFNQGFQGGTGPNGQAVSSGWDQSRDALLADMNATQAAANRQFNRLDSNNQGMGMIMESIGSIPIAYTIGCFLFYFLFGYLIYSSLFAMVGSAVDNETETQQFMLPITMPLIFTIILSMNFVINNPDSSLSVWLSMIPFTSPIAMMIRIPFGVPAWQLALSMLLMILGFLVTVWVAARIYRVGILMYGKKASYKELAKWFMYKE